MVFPRKLIFEVVCISFISSATAAPGDLIKDRNGCYIELEGGEEQKIECPQATSTISSGISLKEKKMAVDDLQRFDESPIASSLKRASKIKSKGELDKSKYSKDTLSKLNKMKDGYYLINLVFQNTGNYPKKSNRGHGYYSVTESGFNRFSASEAHEIDANVISDLLGHGFSSDNTAVQAITASNVTLVVKVESSKELENLLEGKSVKSVSHIGSKEIEYEEIKPITFSSN